jgi:hypothetical protein
MPGAPKVRSSTVQRFGSRQQYLQLYQGAGLDVKLGQTDLWLVLSTVGSGTVAYHSFGVYCYKQTIF